MLLLTEQLKSFSILLCMLAKTYFYKIASKHKYFHLSSHQVDLIVSPNICLFSKRLQIYFFSLLLKQLLPWETAIAWHCVQLDWILSHIMTYDGDLSASTYFMYYSSVFADADVRMKISMEISMHCYNCSTDCGSLSLVFSFIIFFPCLIFQL